MLVHVLSHLGNQQMHWTGMREADYSPIASVRAMAINGWHARRARATSRFGSITVNMIIYIIWALNRRCYVALWWDHGRWYWYIPCGFWLSFVLFRSCRFVRFFRSSARLHALMSGSSCLTHRTGVLRVEFQKSHMLSSRLTQGAVLLRFCHSFVGHNSIK